MADFDGGAGLSEVGYGGSDIATSSAPPQHGNLFVKGLPQEMDEAGLTVMFQNFGLVDTCRIIRNGRTMASKGYGFIKFAEAHQAAAAIAAVHGQPLQSGAILEVKHADLDAGGHAQGRTPSDNLYIRGLPASWSDEDLANLFAPYGGVKECRMLHPKLQPGADPSCQTAGGLVRLSSVDVANAAISALNDSPSLSGPGGPPLLVRFADTPEEKQRKAARKERFAGGSGWRGAGMMGGGSMPAGFTAFGGESPDSRQQGYQQSAAVAPYGGMTVGYGTYGRSAGPAVMGYGDYGSGRGAVSASLYIKNLPPHADKLFLYEQFAPMGAILSVRVLTDDSGACRGVGFVNYNDPRAAASAAASLNGTRLGDKPLHVSIQPVKQRSPQRPLPQAGVLLPAQEVQQGM